MSKKPQATTVSNLTSLGIDCPQKDRGIKIHFSTVDIPELCIEETMFISMYIFNSFEKKMALTM